MDIAVRAHLSGWKFIYLNDVKCMCELPESYAAYKKQQYRWHSGPMQLFRLCFMDIIRSKKTHPSILLIHSFLHNSSINHVLTRSPVAILGSLLYPDLWDQNTALFVSQDCLDSNHDPWPDSFPHSGHPKVKKGMLQLEAVNL